MNERAQQLRDAAEALRARGVAFDADAFVRSPSMRAAGAHRVHVTDLAVAWACARHDEKAIAWFEAQWLPQASRALKKLQLGSAVIDDVLGWLRFELFARDDQRGPLIAQYSGRGDLASWVRAVAVHEGLKHVRRQRRDVTPEAAADLPMPEVELAAMRGAMGAAFTSALEESFHALGAAERTLLRQHFLDGLSIDVLAGLLQIHRSTAARRVVAARTALVDGVRARLSERLALNDESVDQVITLSNLQESLSALLRHTRSR
jgi:RNA polymerase sigma-70 factor, ECF subfamily